MKVFLTYLITFIVAVSANAANASTHVLENNFKADTHFQSETNKGSVVNHLNENFNNKQLLLDCEEEEENESEKIFASLFALCTELNTPKTIINFKSAYFSKNITHRLPRYITLEVFLI